MDNVIAEPPEPGSTEPPRGSALAKRDRTLVVSDQCVAWVLPKVSSFCCGASLRVPGGAHSVP